MHTHATSGRTDAWAQIAAYRASNASSQTDTTGASAAAAGTLLTTGTPSGNAVTGSTASPASNDLIAALMSLQMGPNGSATSGGGAQGGAPQGSDSSTTVLSALQTLLSDLSGGSSPTSTPAPGLNTATASNGAVDQASLLTIQPVPWSSSSTNPTPGGLPVIAPVGWSASSDPSAASTSSSQPAGNDWMSRQIAQAVAAYTSSQSFSTAASNASATNLVA